MQLAQLNPGDRAKIIDVRLKDKRLRQELFARGLVRGQTLNIQQIAPFGDPILIDISGSLIALRKHEASYFIVERLP